MNDKTKIEENAKEEIENVEAVDETTDESAKAGKEGLLATGEAPEFKWYVVHVLSGFEHRVKKTLVERIVNHKLTEYFAEVFLPEEEVTANVKGKKRNMKKKFFPGYLLIKMVLNDKTWHLVKDTDKITSFVSGDRNKPTPISEKEASYLLGQAEEGFKQVKTTASFSEGDSVKVIEGPFASFVGTVEAVSDKGKLKVNVSIFGRPTPVELDFSQVEKA
ncbi:MAG: transcription termination/antitermination protein NusG [Halobacteriovoraceae bacterium]|nr:transcription termination/antitermination protein NusG [Halobacteriovoraceae bacterium]